jgi:ABC-type tungstate transport system permease subunit
MTRSMARLAIMALLFVLPVSSRADPLAQSITLASTTSVDNSGLLGAILPTFTKASGISVHVLALGTGQALDTARRGDADLVLVHDPEAERKFIEDGNGIDRRQLAVAVESDPHLINRYDVIELNPAKHPNAKLAAAHKFADWLVSAAGQTAIGAYRVGGQQLFNPSADHPK